MRWVLTAPPRGHTRETREGGARVRREESGDGSEWSRGGGRTRGHTRRTRRREEQCRRGRGIEYGCGEIAPQQRRGEAFWRAVERRSEAILADPPTFFLKRSPRKGHSRGHTRRASGQEKQCRRGRGIEYGCSEMAQQRREGTACWRAGELRKEAVLAAPSKEAQGTFTLGSTRGEGGH